jgi:predicted nucleic acid-binding protein
LIGYLDTSALVKLFVLEQGSREVDEIASRADALATSVVAYAEARASFARLLREGLTTARKHGERVAKLNSDWERYVRIELTPALARSSGETAEATGCVALIRSIWQARFRCEIESRFPLYLQLLISDYAARRQARVW